MMDKATKSTINRLSHGSWHEIRKQIIERAEQYIDDHGVDGIDNLLSSITLLNHPTNQYLGRK